MLQITIKPKDGFSVIAAIDFISILHYSSYFVLFFNELLIEIQLGGI